MVPFQRPSMSSGNSQSFSSGEAWASSASIWPWLISGQSESERQAEASISLTITA